MAARPPGQSVIDAPPGFASYVQGRRLLASGNTGLRTASLKILMAMPDRPATIRRFIAALKDLAGWVRDRALDSLREFGADVVEPALTLVNDPDADVRAATLGLLSSHELGLNIASDVTF